MRNYGLAALLFIVLCPALRAQHGGVSAGRLRAAYEALAGEGGRARQRHLTASTQGYANRALSEKNVTNSQFIYHGKD